jgi:hypothetical protein
VDEAVGESAISRSRWNSGGAAALPLALILVLSGTVAYLSMHETDMHTWRRVGDIDAVACVLVLGGLLFPLATIVACRMEELKAPHLADHFRQSSILYALVVLGALALVGGKENQGSLGYAIAATGVIGAMLGIVANVVTLAARGRRARLSE